MQIFPAPRRWCPGGRFSRDNERFKHILPWRIESAGFLSIRVKCLLFQLSKHMTFNQHSAVKSQGPPEQKQQDDQ
jgi:hypothetical protein